MVLGFIGIGVAAGVLAAGLTLWCGGGPWLAVLAYALAGTTGTLAIGLLHALRERQPNAPYLRAERA